MNDVFMQRFTTDQLVLYLSGQLRPITIPEMPMFLTFNVALVRKGMDLSHGGEGLTDAQYAEYKYVIDLDGDGCSGRLSKVFESGAVVLKPWQASRSVSR